MSFKKNMFKGIGSIAGLCLLGISIVSAQTDLEFLTDVKARPVLNCNQPVTKDIQVNSSNSFTMYGADIMRPDTSGLPTPQYDGYNASEKSGIFLQPDRTYTPEPFSLGFTITNGATGTRLFSQGTYAGDYISVYSFMGTNATATALGSNNTIGRLIIDNKDYYYLTGHDIPFFPGIQNGSQTKYSLGAGTIDYDNVDTLQAEYWAAPCVEDTLDPVFTLVDFPSANVNRQDINDFEFLFNLTDNGGTTSSNGWIRDPGTNSDWELGSGFRPNENNPSFVSTITNQDGIDPDSLVLDIIITSGWDQSTYNSLTTLSYTSGTAGLTLTGADRTWRYFFKNYSGHVDRTTFSSFGIEERITISGYVADRNMYPDTAINTWEDIKGHSPYNSFNTTSFAYSFNQGMRPRWNNNVEGSYTHTPTCEFDIQRFSTGFIVTEMSGYMHDDWAGIDTSSIQVEFVGFVNNSEQTDTYTISDTSVIALTQFDNSNDGCRNASNANGNTSSTPSNNTDGSVCNEGVTSTGNYLLEITNPVVYDAEDPITVTISFNDLKDKVSRPVSCTWNNNEANPRYVNTGVGGGDINSFSSSYFASLFSLNNYPLGGQIEGIHLQLQDDWAGVNSGTISASISGSRLDGTLQNITAQEIDLNYNASLYSAKQAPDLRRNTGSPAYPGYLDRTNTSITTIPGWQVYNYELYFDQTAVSSPFTGYFAPEQDVNFSLTFNDDDIDLVSDYAGAGNYPNGKTATSVINVTYSNSEAPIFREHDKTTSFTGGSDLQLIGGSDTSVLFSGSEQKIYAYDNTGFNTGVSQEPIAFRVTDNWAGVDSGSITVTIEGNRWGYPQTHIFNITSGLFLSNFDRGDEGGRNLLNYLGIIENHDIFFDRQSYDQAQGSTIDSSTYTITLEASDLRKPDSNDTTVIYNAEMENLQCQDLGRCNAFLYFTYKYDGLTGDATAVVDTGVHAFVGQKVYIIGSGVSINTGAHYIDCQGGTALSNPVDIVFTGASHRNGVAEYNGYDNGLLYVADGLFELTGANNDILILK